MENLFIPQELTLKLHNIGFDEPCFAKHDDRGGVILLNGLLYRNSFFTKNNIDVLCAPTYQQVFDWFRTVHKYNYLLWEIEGMGSYEIAKIDSHLDDVLSFHMEEYFENYHLARTKCLEKLIELVEKEKLSC